jgi:predicted nucleotidyltransferase
MDFEDLKKQIINNFSEFKEIRSAYIYGSSISDRFDPKKSDVDILFICDDLENPKKFFNKIIRKKNKISTRLDINIVFYQEFLKRWHIYRPPTYFIGIKNAHQFLWGKNLILSVKESDFRPKDLYKRITDLAQGSRGVYINGKNDSFWIKKYKGWLKIFVLEILYMQGIFNLDFSAGLSYFLKINPELIIIKNLSKKDINIRQVNDIAETLKVYVYNNFIKK